MNLIDTHCHLTYPGLFQGVEAVIARAAQAGVTRMVTIGTHPEDHPRALHLADKHAAVFAAVGIHPHHAGEITGEYRGALREAIKSHPKVVALGECGLDYHYDFAPRDAQKRIFGEHLELARELDVPVILHIREAHADGLAVVRDFIGGERGITLVVHCFTGTPAECEAWLALGAYIGITGIVTYKNAGDVRDSARRVPPDRLLVETDAPYLAPEPVRKIKTNEPAHVAHTARFLASLRGVSEDELARQTTENAGRFYGPKLLA